MSSSRLRVICNILIAAMTCFAVAPAAADDDVAAFYRGKNVRILIPASPGGEYDLIGRLTAKHLGRFIPGNPAVIPINMPGAIGLTMSNHLHTIAERDGTALGLINNNQPMMEAIGAPGIRFKLADFNWVGAIAPVENMIVIRSARGIRSIDDARRVELVAGSMGRGNLTYAFPALMNDFVGTRFKIVTGYVSGPEMNIAMERGEVDARNTTWSSLRATNASWVRDGLVDYLVQAGARSREPALAKVPSIEDLARDGDDRAVIDLIFAGSRMGRPLAAPPGVPAERLAALQAAFQAMTSDAAFIHDAQASSIEVDAVRGPALKAIIDTLQAMPKSVAVRAKRYFE